MTRFAIDPETLVQLVRADRSVHRSHQLVAPSSVRTRALDLLLPLVRTGTVTEGRALELHERMTELKVRALGDRVSRRTAWQLAVSLDWTVADAEFLAVATLQADALVTKDPVLRRHAKGKVRVAKLDELFDR